MLADLTQATDMMAELAKLRAENEALRAGKAAKGLTLKVTEPRLKDDGTWTKGGAVSVYGMGRFPVTLYRGQWERLMAHSGELKAFIEANAGKLSTKE